MPALRGGRTFGSMVDLKVELKPLYTAHAEPELVGVPELPFLMVDGHGAPGGDAFADAIKTLYGAAFRIRFALKREGVEFKVMPLEGLYSPDALDWTLMIAQPPEVTEELAGDVRLERFEEGLAVQVLHVGPYDQEAPTIARLHAAIAELGYAPAGRHHEIYLGDPRRCAPERLRTILRQAVTLAP